MSNHDHILDALPYDFHKRTYTTAASVTPPKVPTLREMAQAARDIRPIASSLRLGYRIYTRVFTHGEKMQPSQSPNAAFSMLPLRLDYSLEPDEARPAYRIPRDHPALCTLCLCGRILD